MEYKFSDKLASLKPSAIREIFKSLTDPTIISFAAGNPSPLSFPVEALSKISADIFANDSTTALQYSITEGYVPLREDVVARLNKKFSIDASLPPAVSRGSNLPAKRCAMKAMLSYVRIPHSSAL